MSFYSQVPIHVLTYPYSVTKEANESQLEEIKSYARLVRSGVTTLDRIKVYFCGQPEAGKTTLAHVLSGRLTELKVDDNILKTRTRGIVVSNIKLANGAEYSFWDFAGQIDYHVHHDMFMFPEGAIFVVLVDLRASADERRQHATYWLQYILTQCPSSVKPNILVVATHADQADAAMFPVFSVEIHVSLLIADLITLFGNHVAFVTTDAILLNCTEAGSSGLTRVQDEIEAARIRFTAENPAPTPLICKKMIDELAKLREQGTKIMTMEQFGEAMHLLVDDSELFVLAAKHLHSIGEIYIGHGPKLEGTVIVDIPWLCHDVFGWLFSPQDQLQAHDKLDLLRFHRLAEQGPVPADEIPTIGTKLAPEVTTLDVLELFELCYGFELEGAMYYVFPSLLRTHRAELLWGPHPAFDAHVGLRFVCTDATRMLPPGFFQRVQIRSRLDIGPRFTGTDLNGASIWMNGTLCQSDGVQACIQLSADERSIFVHVRASTEDLKPMRKMLQSIVRVIQLVCQSSPGLTFDVEHSSVVDLQTYHSEPFTYKQEAVIDARDRNRRNIMTSDGHVDQLQAVLGFDVPGKY